MVLILCTSCNKTEGPGGKTTIRGTIITRVYDKDFKVLQSEHPSTETDVYLVYGEETYYGDHVSTNMNGTFEFEYLRPGSYKVYFYSEDSTLSDPAGEIVIDTTVTITKGDDIVNIGTLYKAKTLEPDEGYASICGKMRALNYDNKTMIFVDTTTAPGEDVYIQYENSNTPYDRIRTGPDGSFCFTRLLKGKYTIYGLSESKLIGSYQQTAEKRVVTIDSEYEAATVTDILVVRQQ